jgi:hypothetical protein
MFLGAQRCSESNKGFFEKLGAKPPYFEGGKIEIAYQQNIVGFLKTLTFNKRTYLKSWNKCVGEQPMLVLVH